MQHLRHVTGQLQGDKISSATFKTVLTSCLDSAALETKVFAFQTSAPTLKEHSEIKLINKCKMLRTMTSDEHNISYYRTSVIHRNTYTSVNVTSN